MAATRLAETPPPAVARLRTDHKSGVELHLRFDSFPQTRIGPTVDLFHVRRQRRTHIPQMIANLSASEAIAIAQLTPQVFAFQG